MVYKRWMDCGNWHHIKNPLVLGFFLVVYFLILFLDFLHVFHSFSRVYPLSY